MKTNFISRYEKALTRQECRDIIEDIEFFDSNGFESCTALSNAQHMQALQILEVLI